jgi:two-component system alkaline phosphatase synthesis response regulator PhoP
MSVDDQACRLVKLINTGSHQANSRVHQELIAMAKRILMIEDDREMVTLGKLILEREGYEVLVAYGGAEGLNLLRQEDSNVDLLLLDIMMTGMDGWQVLTEVKTDQKLRHIPVIMLTARHYLEDEDETATYADKFEHYVVKPFVVRDLLAEIAKVLNRS